MRKITPFLWFDDNAEEAARFYVSVFPNSRVRTVTRYSEAGAEASGRPKGSVMTVTFEIDGRQVIALNGGPNFRFTEAVSFVVNCDSQKQVDDLWEKLCRGGEEGQCGWLKDRYGLSWQIVPSALAEMVSDPDPARSDSVVRALVKMKKIDLAELRKAYDTGKAA